MTHVSYTIVGFGISPPPDISDIAATLEARYGVGMVSVMRVEFTPPIVTMPRPLVLPVGAKAIDVSTWQGGIVWSKVRNVAGVEYAMIRATNGTVKDTRFSLNWQAAQAVGVKRGSYHYWQNEVNPQAQAAAFVAAHDGDFGELLWALDIEDQQPPFTQAEMIDIRAFLDLVELQTGKRGYIYTGRSVWNFPDETWAKEYKLWMAAYSNTGYTPLLPWPNPTLWQHTSRGVIPGITENTVDLNTAGDGLAPIVSDWYWRGCTPELPDANGNRPLNFFVNAVANPLNIYDAPGGNLIKTMAVVWRMIVLSVTATGWLKIHQVGAVEWWIKSGDVRLA